VRQTNYTRTRGEKARLIATLPVCHSKSRADDAFVAIYDRDHWFTIADMDVRSNEMFLAAHYLLLQTPQAGAALVLTSLVRR
jgi:hypothetical protein